MKFVLDDDGVETDSGRDDKRSTLSII